MNNTTDSMLLTIASHFSQHDLCSYILIARSFARAGQDTVYRHPIVPSSQETRRGGQTFTLSRTILYNPTLTTKVRSSELYPRLDKRSRDPRVRHAAVDATALCLNAPHRLKDVFSDLSVLVCEYALTGFIL